MSMRERFSSTRIFTSPGTTRVYLIRNEQVQCELQIWCHCPQPWNIDQRHNKLISWACTILGWPEWGDLSQSPSRRTLDMLGLKLDDEIEKRWPKDWPHEVKISWCKKHESPAWSEFTAEEDITRRIDVRQY
jgi:hypothetical protein